MNKCSPASEWQHACHEDLEMYGERFLPQDPENSAFDYWYSVKQSA